jgi:asparagine N-glycosylation enzyme membrane subunit Stt3
MEGIPNWRRSIAPYAKAHSGRGLLDLLCTALPFLVLLVGIFLGLAHEIWAALVLIPSAAAFLVRLLVYNTIAGTAPILGRAGKQFLGRTIGGSR